MYKICMDLAGFTPLCIFDGIGYHGWPIVTKSVQSILEFRTWLISSAYTIMRLFKYFLCFWIREAMEQDIVIWTMIEYFYYRVIVETERPSSNRSYFFRVIRQYIMQSIVNEENHQSLGLKSIEVTWTFLVFNTCLGQTMCLVATVRWYVVSIGKANVAASAAKAPTLVFWDQDMIGKKQVQKLVKECGSMLLLLWFFRFSKVAIRVVSTRRESAESLMLLLYSRKEKVLCFK